MIPLETERKFLVRGDAYRPQAVRADHICQGYLAHEAGNTVRVRIRGDKGYLTIKGPGRDGLSRPEWEREIPLSDAQDLLQLCIGGRIEKIRYLVPAAGLGPGRYFEVDEFQGDNDGLVMAELELTAPDEPFARPSWLGEEVTGDPRYYNASLMRRPYTTW